VFDWATANGVTSMTTADDIGSVIRSAVCNRLGLPCIDMKTLIYCNNKYLTKVAIGEKDKAWIIDPEEI